jgi:hypothetical protein
MNRPAKTTSKAGVERVNELVGVYTCQQYLQLVVSLVILPQHEQTCKQKSSKQAWQRLIGTPHVCSFTTAQATGRIDLQKADKSHQHLT